MDEMDAAQAKALLEKDRQRRLAACSEAINAALQEYGMRLVAVPRIAEDGRIVAAVQLVPGG